MDYGSASSPVPHNSRHNTRNGRWPQGDVRSHGTALRSRMSRKPIPARGRAQDTARYFPSGAARCDTRVRHNAGKTGKLRCSVGAVSQATTPRAARQPAREDFRASDRHRRCPAVAQHPRTDRCPVPAVGQPRALAVRSPSRTSIVSRRGTHMGRATSC